MTCLHTWHVCTLPLKAGLDLESWGFTGFFYCAKCEDFQMHNSRKWEEMSHLEEKPQRHLFNMKRYCGACLSVNVCVLRPLWFESFSNFIVRILRDKMGLFRCVLLSPPHMTHFPTVKVKILNVNESLRIHVMVTWPVRKETNSCPNCLTEEKDDDEEEVC